MGEKISLENFQNRKYRVFRTSGRGIVESIVYRHLQDKVSEVVVVPNKDWINSSVMVLRDEPGTGMISMPKIKHIGDASSLDAVMGQMKDYYKNHKESIMPLSIRKSNNLFYLFGYDSL